ncbi:glycerate kinase [Nocardia goodfellowii]|uniref:Glycerate kinase n=1 Tax=Nocardia goodfellowii TaxID=882446 RepID=A0ABS4QQQ2_9NOCA|nr:glycerate kinase [Nocardia goodfellowii]MBP2194012.1 glycerate kinase [Nocardia goodfellowii]
MRVLVAPDKFKGSLTASEVADRLAEGLASAGIDSHRIPLADGGDGSVDAAIAAGFAPHPVTVAGAAGTPSYGRIARGDGGIVVEVANTCGLTTLPNGRPLPLDASSLGLGQAISQALRHRPRRLVLALGGSASTDGGMGMLAALGFTFADARGIPLRACGRSLARVHTVDSSRAQRLTGIDIVVAGDVTNPLLGPTGAAAVYGPQKGATEAEVRFLDAGLGNLVRAFARSGYPNAAAVASVPGAGSAGGIGFASLLLGGTITSGAEFFLDLLQFDRHLPGSDLVLTGEGSIDDQTANGKLPAVLARRAHPVPVVAVAGRTTLPPDQWRGAGFADIYSLGDYTDRDTADDPELTRQLLIRIGRQIGRVMTEAPSITGPVADRSSPASSVPNPYPDDRQAVRQGPSPLPGPPRWDGPSR